MQETIMFLFFVITALSYASCLAIRITAVTGRSSANVQQSGQCLVTYHYLPPRKEPEATDNNYRPSEQGQLYTSAATTSTMTKAATTRTTVISFNVGLSETKTYSSTGSNIVWDQVLDNSGHSYDLSTGRVTAPVTGRYYFAVTSVSPTEDSSRADVDIMVNGSMLCRVTSPVLNSVGSCQGVRQMSAGDQAWVQAYNGTNTLKGNASLFTGFLLAGAGDASRVSFTVRMTSTKQYNSGRESVIWDQALDNYGQSMNLTTGTFTAPATGQYYFAFAITPPSSNIPACADVRSHRVIMCSACSFSRQNKDNRRMASCQATANLSAGHTVWVEHSASEGAFRAEVSTFSGFLVSGDQVPSVSFTASVTVKQYNTDSERVVWNITADNTGGGYDNNTGHFTAPVAGYYLIAVTTTSRQNYRADVEVVTSEGQTVCRVTSGVDNYDQDTGSCQGVVRLDVGVRVWVQTLHCPCHLYYYCYFTGFLIQPVTF